MVSFSSLSPRKSSKISGLLVALIAALATCASAGPIDSIFEEDNNPAAAQASQFEADNSAAVRKEGFYQESPEGSVSTGNNIEVVVETSPESFASRKQEEASEVNSADDATVSTESVLRRFLHFPGFSTKNGKTKEDDEDEEDDDWQDTSNSNEYDTQWDDDDNENDEDEEEDDDDDYDDCDNGNDDDDGSQWHTAKANNDLVDQPGFGRPVRTRFSRTSSQGLAPFPAWLAEITKMNQWPGHEPPYIPTANIDLTNLPVVPQRGLGDCTQVTLEHCSFDCFRCLALDEIMSCPVLSQTFDDGPSPATPKLLDNLPGKTTFFTQGINVVRFPDTFRMQHAKGHLLASHTWSHANLPGSTNEQIAAQIQWSIWAMNATAGIVPRYFRPPYGASDNRVRAIARQFGLVSVFWDHDTFDWQVNDKKKSPAQVIEDVRGWRAENHNGLILEHDSTIDTVNVGIDVAKMLGPRQYTVAECVNGRWYQNI